MRNKSAEILPFNLSVDECILTLKKFSAVIKIFFAIRLFCHQLKSTDLDKMTFIRRFEALAYIWCIIDMKEKKFIE